MAVPRLADSDIVASMSTELTDACLHAGEYVDSAAPEIVAFARQTCGDATDDIADCAADDATNNAVERRDHAHFTSNFQRRYLIDYLPGAFAEANAIVGGNHVIERS